MGPPENQLACLGDNNRAHRLYSIARPQMGNEHQQIFNLLSIAKLLGSLGKK
jgi:hypothetical protein